MWHLWGTGWVYTGVRWERSGGWGQLGRPESRSENNIKVELREMGWERGLD